MLSIVKFSKNGNYYTAVIENGIKVDSSRIEQKFVSAIKKENNIYIDMKVVFIKENKVYKEPNYTNPISKDSKAEEEWFGEANTYRHTYDIIDNNYVLTNISLIK